MVVASVDEGHLDVWHSTEFLGRVDSGEAASDDYDVCHSQLLRSIRRRDERRTSRFQRALASGTVVGLKLRPRALSSVTVAEVSSV